MTRFTVHEHRPHSGARPSFDLCDTTQYVGKQHIGMALTEDVAFALAAVLNKHADEYQAAHDQYGKDNPF